MRNKMEDGILNISKFTNNSMTKLTELPQWKALQQHFSLASKQTIASLFQQDPNRFQNFSLQVGQLFVDYSKNKISNSTLDLLIELAQAREVLQWRDKMFSAEEINFTETRAVLHTALRNRSSAPVKYKGVDVMPGIHRVLAKMGKFSQKIRNQEWLGFSSKAITDVVNIGIGGSDLGPRMAVTALKPYAIDSIDFHFVANIDSSEIYETLKRLNPKTTLFIISSKSFTTQETMENANTARDWLLSAADGEVKAIAKHFVAVSSNTDAVQAFGIDSENMFEFWDWVGGRYSLWSAIGLPIVIALGMDQFEEILEGAYELDQHFLTAPIESNLPIILALLGIWYFNFHGAETHGIFPYDYYLRDLPNYLQQADMESNGKRITRDNEEVDYTTGPIIWGNRGVNGQHAFFQLIHQGTRLIPSDFILPVQAQHAIKDQHLILAANFLAQTEALLKGRTQQEVQQEMLEKGVDEKTIELLAKHRTCLGNQPTTSILIKKLTPKAFGNLIAMYEHKIFVQGTIWNINSFDQWGVELGKVLSNKVLAELKSGKEIKGHGQSTDSLINYFINNQAN